MSADSSWLLTFVMAFTLGAWLAFLVWFYTGWYWQWLF